MTQDGGDAGRLDPGASAGHSWTAGLTRLAEQLEAFTVRLLEAQHTFQAVRGEPVAAVGTPAGHHAEGAPAPDHPHPTAGWALRDRLDATERLLNSLEAERRRDGERRGVALADAARRLEHAQRLLEHSRRRLAGEDVAAPPVTGAARAWPPSPPPSSPSHQAAQPDAPSSSLRAEVRAEEALARVAECEQRISRWEQEVERHAGLLERVAQAARNTELELSARGELEQHIAALIDRLTSFLPFAPDRP